MQFATLLIEDQHIELTTHTSLNAAYTHIQTWTQWIEPSWHMRLLIQDSDSSSWTEFGRAESFYGKDVRDARMKSLNDRGRYAELLSSKSTSTGERGFIFDGDPKLAEVL